MCTGFVLLSVEQGNQTGNLLVADGMRNTCLMAALKCIREM